MNQSNLTKKDLEGKTWYRVLKVLYITAYIPLIAIIIIAMVTDGGSLDLLILSVVYILIVEIVKKAIFYIILGKR